MPVYPTLARSASVQGVVIIEATVSESGDVVSARVLRSIPMLDLAALDAVRQWKYKSIHADGLGFHSTLRHPEKYPRQTVHPRM